MGRTHRLNAPCGTLLDRFREPVLRNDFIATTESVISSPGDPLTDAITGDPLFFVHVDSTAGAGGDGTFENPFATLEEAETGSAENNIILAHGGSVFNPTQTITLQNDQRWLGEGTPDPTDPNSVPVVHTVNTAERGIVELPETAPGAQDLESPVINAGGIAGGDPNTDMLFELADDDEINNFEINGGTRAVVGTGIDSPRLANLDINDPNGDAIVFTDVTGSSLIENTVTIDNAGGRGIFIDGGSGVVGANAAITDSIGYLIEITGRGGGSITVGELVQTGVGQGVFVHDNTGGNVTFSSFADITTVGPNSAVELENNTGATISFQQLQASSGDADTFIVRGGGTVSVSDPTAVDPNQAAFIENTGTGAALVVRGEDDPNTTGNPAVTILADITNEGGGQAVDIQRMTGGSVSVTGDVTDIDQMGLGILVESNTAGTYSFAGAVNLDTLDNSAVVLRNNTGATINFSNLEATARDANTFYVKGGGTIAVNDPNDTGDINNTGTGTALFVRGDGDPNGVGNPTLTIAANVNNGGGGRVVDIQDMTGGGVTISGDVNDPNGDSLGILVQNNTAGTYAFTGDTTIATEDADNAVTLQDNTGATINFTNLNATAVDGNTLAVIGGGTVNVNDPNDDAQLVNTGTGSALFVSGDAGTGTGNATVTVAADITNTGGGKAVFIEDMTGGAVSVTGDVTDPNGSDGGGILIQDNTAGTATFTGDITLNTGTTDAVVITGNSAAHTTTFQATSQLDIDTTSGDGIVINGAGAVSVLGSGNTIDTTMPGGIGMNITNARSATLNNVTINADDDAVNIEHNNATASAVTLNNLIVESSTNVGVDVLANGTGQFDVIMDEANITNTGQAAIRFDTGAGANRVDFTLTDSEINVGDVNAFLATLDDTDTADVRFLIDRNELLNSSVGNATLDISVTSGLLLSATIGNGPSGLDPNAPVGPIGDRNRFVNTGAAGADAVVISANGGNARINLDLRDNTAQADDLEFRLNQTAPSTFGLVDRDDTLNDENNIGDVSTNGGAFNNIPAPVLQPTAP